nr:GWxTD domain-containing protein [Bacteroidota bacterium]
MKKLFLTITFLCIILSVHAKSLTASLTFAKFYSAADGPYVETYLSVDGNSVHFVKNANNKFQATITITFLVKDELGQIKHSDKYNLLSPEVEDTVGNYFNFIDQQRLALSKGKYSFDITIADKNSTQKPFTTSNTVFVNHEAGTISISDIVLIDKYTKAVTPTKTTKNGYDLIPYGDNYFYPGMNKLTFYAEIYNTAAVLKDEMYLLTYSLIDAESRSVVGNLTTFKKQTPKETEVLLSEFDIKEVQSGNYILLIEVKNKANELLAFGETFIQRNNGVRKEEPLDLESININQTFVSSINNRDSLVELIACLHPISSASEGLWQDNQLKAADIDLMKKFLYGFWMRRNKENPELAFRTYMHEVAIANANYCNKFIKGYNSDRGKVYLKYGPPNIITPSLNEPDAYPYEVWHYYKIKKFSNKKFLFYNTHLTSNDMELLHSDMPGELFDSRWKMKLYKRNSQSLNLDNESPGKESNFGTHADDLFNNPK